MNPHASSGKHTEEWRRSGNLRWKVLDPAGQPRGEETVDDNYHEEPGVPVYSTVYVSDELIVAGSNRDAVRNREGGIVEIARRAGWSIDPLNLEDGRPVDPDAPIRARLSVAPSTGSAGSGVTAQTPDAWEILRQARADNDGSAEGVSLNHVLTTDSYGLNPFTANPFTANPFTIGGTLTVSQLQAPGVYTGSVQVSVQYN